jgi:hypothetical protein
MALGVDYPWTHPAPAALQAAGVDFALRYLSTDPSKNLTRGEADALAAVGVWCGVVWETTAGRALAGRAAGAADARAAVAQAKACGMPAGRPIYFAVDTDTTWGAVSDYFAGITDVLPPAQIGVYGGIKITQAAAAVGLVTWFWQTLAWSNGRWDPRAHIRQTGSITVGGVECDRNQSMTSDFGQWMPGRTPTQEDDMALTDEMIGSWNSMIWGLKNTCEATQRQLAAQSAAIAQLATVVAANHGIDPAQLIQQIEQAIANAVVHVQVDVNTPSPTNS